MSSLSTAPAEPALTPRRRSEGSWALFVAVVVLGAVLAAVGPAGDGRGYGWAVFGFVALMCVRLVVEDERFLRLPNRDTAMLAVFGAAQGVGLAVRAQDLGLGLMVLGVGVGVGAVYAVIAACGGCGFGDAKFAAALAVAVAPFAGWLALYLVPLAFVVSLVRVLPRQLRGRSTAHPHGASIAVGGLAVMVMAQVAGPVFGLA